MDVPWGRLGPLTLLLLFVLTLAPALAQPLGPEGPGLDPGSAGAEPRDCQAILAGNPGAASGYYTVDPDGRRSHPSCA